MDNPGPLCGYRVVDLTTTMSGPCATMILADQGADVIKVEAPGGDVLRRIGPGRGGMSGYYATLNRGKRSIVLDLQADAAREVMYRLLATADVFVHNLKVGAAERLGMGADELRARFSTLIYASINGFGSTTTRATDPAYDQIMQALSGIAARQATKDGPPELIRHGAVDKITGYTMAQAITAALLRRTRTGAGEVIEVAMLDAAIQFLWMDGMAAFTCLEEDQTRYNDLAGAYQATPTQDGYVSLNAITDRQFEGLMKAVDLEFTEELRTVEGRGRHGGDAMREVKKRLGELSTDDVVARMQRFGVPCAPVVALADLRLSPAVVDNQIVREVHHPIVGRIAHPRPAPRMVGVDDVVTSPAAALGAHTDELLAELRYSEAEVSELRAGGAAA
jgi:crotonobetainyl-CoA:carnitine CoA-transferase CaiB-like acyl-CoA transferase